jgi:RNA polymerase sigma-70 factor (ECF subfamily)
MFIPGIAIPGIALALQMSAEHDEDLARRLQRRDPEAMTDLYDRFGRLAWSVIVAIVRDAAVAEDLVQESFLRVWNGAHAFEPGRGALGPWLLAIARDRAIDHLRSVNVSYGPGIGEHPALFLDMEREVLNTDQTRPIRNAIARLSADQRKLIELAYYEGLSQPGMAERVGAPLATVRTSLRTVLKHVREELGQAVAHQTGDAITCEELRQDYTSYALGVADDPERSEIAEHLARNCPGCIPGVTSAMATVTAMSGAVPLTELPKHLRQRVMALVEKTPKRSWAATFVPWAITAAMSIALVTIGLTGRRRSGDTGRLQQALPILNDPAAKDVSFGKADNAVGGRIVVSPGKGVVFIGAGLPRIDKGKTFELWVTPVNGNPAPAGLFQSQPDATAVFVRPGPVENTAAITVTVEPEGGSAQPTTTPFIVMKL